MNAIVIRQLRPSLILLATVLLIGASSWLHFSGQRDEAARIKQEAHQRRIAQTTAQARASAEQLEAAQLANTLPVAENSGLLDQGNRLEWIETLRRIRAQHSLQKIDYEIAPQQNAEAALIESSGTEWQWQATPIKLQLAALHEQDLLHLLVDLRQQTRPWLHVRRCSITRALTTRAQGPAAQLAAECELQWIHARRSAEARS